MHNYKTMMAALIAALNLFPFNSMADSECSVLVKQNTLQLHNLAESAIAKELGWVTCDENRCGGYYLESPFTFSKELENSDQIQVTANQMLFAQHGTSIGQGQVTINRFGQQINANKAYLYRDPVTGKLSAIDLIDNVTLREPNSMVFAKSGHFDIKTKGKSLYDILYRTTIYNNPAEHKRDTPSTAAIVQPRKVTQLSAWGKAAEFKQTETAIYEFRDATYSTCPPISNTWQVRAGSINLNKNTGRGLARNARIYVKGIPVFYTPYLNFPIDARRQTGFLNPTAGTSSKTGAYLRLPFYWNMAPNYDSTLTPAFLAKRGMQLTDLFRYLTPTSTGNFAISVLPNDHAFADQKEAYLAQYGNSPNPYVQADLRRLQNASDTRKSLFWQDNSRFNKHWSAGVDYSYVSDDYYLSELDNHFSEITQNQLLQQGQVYFQIQYWKVLGRIQGYQTLHPVDQNFVQNQYTRLPQIVIEGDYPNGPGGLDYFIMSDTTHFDIHKTPGSDLIPPTGNRLHAQPGISLLFHRPYFYFNPRLQFAMTKYEVMNAAVNNPSGPSRALPIFDIHSGLYFDRDIHFFNQYYRQTLEPQIYYTYVPYKNQDDIPVFDTTVNTLTYDELFMYNRFSGLDRIGDANQISYGLATRLIDQQSGLEKLYAGIGQIFYFENRRVTLCTPPSVALTMIPCVDTPNNPDNTFNKSPLSGVLTYNINPQWSLGGNSIWDVQKNNFVNQTVTLHYQPDPRKIMNVGYSYVRNGDVQVNDQPGSSATNLSQTDFSFAWPINRDWSTVGRWTQNWNHHHFQNLLYGLQYDSCCWAVRFVTGRVFTNLSPNNTYQYNTEFFVQFALKGLGAFGNSDPSQLLSSSISGYQTNFGQDY